MATLVEIEDGEEETTTVATQPTPTITCEPGSCSVADALKVILMHVAGVCSGGECNDKLSSNFWNVLQEVSRLSAVEDPEETPFKSKYKGREILVCLYCFELSSVYQRKMRTIHCPRHCLLTCGVLMRLH